MARRYNSWCLNSWCASVNDVLLNSILVLLIVVSVAFPVTAVAYETHGPSSDFKSHKLVRPKVYHGRSRREIFSTKENDKEHADVLTIGLEINGVERLLDLRLNTDLIPVGYRQRYQSGGTYKTDILSNVELCQYQGSIRDVPGSWVALSTCNGLKGVIFDGESLHHIHPQRESLDSRHYLYKQSDLVANATCGYEGTSEHHTSFSQTPNRASRHKRATETIRGPYNANRQSRYVELVMVVDKKEYTALDENLDKVHQHCKDITNIVNALFMPLNIFVALIGVEVWTDSDEITLSVNGDTTLANFLRYRRERLVKEIPNDNAQLLTGITFEGGVVGKALKGPICTYEFSGGVSMDHSSIVGLVAATIAHELGHNFGMEHDSSDCECPDDKCIMAPSSGSFGPVHWSTCSLEHLAIAFEHGMDYCLRNKPQKLFDSPMCGNGFVEPGEQCDCGLKEKCDNPCCNATTCMLHSNASCATGVCCDLKTCKPKAAGTECRNAERECDLPEFCTGQSEYCPADVFKMDGETCSMGKAFCYQGSCRTHNDQCKLLWGPTGVSSDDQCYDMNNRGNKNGNCGYNRVESKYVRCHDENLLCGMLHCKHLNERLEFGMESVATLSHSFINNGGKIIACRSAIVDLGLNQVDPGLAPDGAKCAPGKMCVNQKCMPVAELRASVYGRVACPNNCGGNGVCNSLGHCHCARGFKPPDCTLPGYGGSEDSGPAEDPNASNSVVTALYVVFLGIVPMIALVAFAAWYMKKNTFKHRTKCGNAGLLSTNERGPPTIKTIDRSKPLARDIESIDSNLNQDPACASLLPKTTTDYDNYNNGGMFGHFKGFTITPISSKSSSATTASTVNELQSSKPAPPPPAIPTVAIKTNLRNFKNPNPHPIRTHSGHGNNNNNNNFIGQLISTKTDPPALPPLNPGCTAKPLISHPVLSATTCTSMELISSKVPTRSAPDVPDSPSASTSPGKPSRPTSTPLTNSIVPPEVVEKKSTGGGGSTIERIASILRSNAMSISRSNSQQSDGRSGTLPKNHHLKASKVLDKELLRNLEISNPIPQKDIGVPVTSVPVGPPEKASGKDEQETKRNVVVMRAQSMRDAKISAKPTIHTFGSMRQANRATVSKRPTSIPTSMRPTSPPPVPPTNLETQQKIPGLPGYQNPPTKMQKAIVDNAYDDCMNLVDTTLGKIREESPNGDNIYAVIEEANVEKKEVEGVKGGGTPGPVANTSTLDSMGLLSEIVSEISNRNFDSIYSTSTLARKKKEKEGERGRVTEDQTDGKKNGDERENLGSNSSLGIYSHYKSPTSSVYSNSTNSTSRKFNSASSTTSSGYLNPRALNVPRKKPVTQEDKSGGSWKVKDEEKAKMKKDEVENPGKPSETSPKSSSGSSSSSLVPSKSASKINSPDVVSSCSGKITTKSPDVLGKVSGNPGKGSKSAGSAKTVPPKPSSLQLSRNASLLDKKKSPTGGVLTSNVGLVKTASKDSKNPLVKQQEKLKSPDAKLNSIQKVAANSKSNVASLQQKFEGNKVPTNAPVRNVTKKNTSKLSESKS